MRQVRKLLLVLLPVLLIFTACGSKDPILSPKTVSCEGISLTVPGHFVDMSEKSWAEGTEFVYGFTDRGVSGLKDSVAAMRTQFPDMDAKGYAELFIQLNDLSCSVTEQDGLVLFSYNAQSGGRTLSYLCGVFMGTTHFWVIQCYCEANELDACRADFMNILRSVEAE